MTQYSALTIAKWFIDKNQSLFEDKGTAPLTNIHVQCFLYFAQGYNLVMTDRPLFEEKLIKYKYGFAVREVYSKFKDYDNRGIENVPRVPNVELYKDTEAILNAVYRDFASFSCAKLVSMIKQGTSYQQTALRQAVTAELLRVSIEGKYLEEREDDND